MNSKGSTALITGATRGIGRAIALRLAENGINIAFSYRSNKKLAESLVQEIEQKGVFCKGYQIDVGSFEDVQNMKKSMLEDFGGLEILVNNAGVVEDSSLALMSKDKWDSVINTNLNGTFNVTKAFIITLLKQKSGHVINMTSYSGVRGMAGQANYAASKGGIIAFTKSLAREAAPYNVRVNAVAPGFIETDMLDNLSEQYLSKAIETVPLGRLGKAEEVAHLVSFLVSDNAKYITGQTIQIDGGLGI